MAESFTDDIFFEILLRLPVKSLMRFKCVRKGWRSLISDPGFARMHLQRLKAGDMIPSQKIIKSRPLETVDHEALDGDDCTVVESHEQRMNSDFWRGSDILGTCDGLVCLCYRGMLHEGCRCLVYNPTTKESRELPYYYVQAELCSGFGYDPRSDDYKIVRFGFCALYFEEGQVAIFSLKSGSWRSIRPQGVSHHADFGLGVYWGGALHWCVNDWSRNNGYGETLITSFDLSEEKFHQMLPVPWAAGNMALAGEEAFAGLGVHGAGLFIYKGSCNYCFEVWITNEYGGRGGGPWTKMFSFSAPINQIVDWKCLIAYTRSGKLVFQNGLREMDLFNPESGLSEMVLFNPEDRTCKKYPIQPDFIKSATIYLETLVSPYHGSEPLCFENGTP